MSLRPERGMRDRHDRAQRTADGDNLRIALTRERADDADSQPRLRLSKDSVRLSDAVIGDHEFPVLAVAEMTGTTRSRVSFFLNKFRKMGLISYNVKIEVHSSLLTTVLNDKPRIERRE